MRGSSCKVLDLFIAKIISYAKNLQPCCCHSHLILRDDNDIDFWLLELITYPQKIILSIELLFLFLGTRLHYFLNLTDFEVKHDTTAHYH